jgi:hypothetical protein
MDPKRVKVPSLQVSQKDSTLDVLSKLLKTWGKCNDDIIEYLKGTEESDPAKF